MKILHNNKIYARIKDSQWTDWAYYNTRIDGDGKYWMLKSDGSDNVHLPLDLLDIPEDETNKTLCKDLLYTQNKTDENGDNKYSIDKGELKEKQGWEEFVDSGII